MEKRMIIAIALSLLILVAFQRLSPRQAMRGRVETPVSSVVTEEQVFPAEMGERREGREAAEEMSLEEIATEIQTEKYTLVFSNIGGSLKKLSLKEYGENEDEEILIDNGTPEGRLFAMQSGLLAGLDRKRFELRKGDDYLEYRHAEPGWLEVTKRYTFHKALDYISLDIFVKNLSSRKVIFSYRMTGPGALEGAHRVAGRTFAQADTMVDGKLWKVRSVKVPQERAGEIAWMAQKNRYFALILKPFISPGSVTIKKTADKTLLTALKSRGYELAPGEMVEDKYLLYAGPLDEKRIAAISDDMQQVVDYGFFGGVSKVLLSILRTFQKGVKNWGVAIICLTVLINLVLFPLTAKSFTSMQRMKKIQPHIEKLKQLHKDNPHKLNKEIMESYKKYNVNPLGGCLPMLLQMPIFVSLYQGLMRSVELKGANFLWIKDLAKPDAVSLPFTLPVIGAHINILPLLMVGMMALQQKLSQGMATAAMTEQQAGQQKMMLLMPLFFGFLFYKMPSGLVLYWLTNTILMTAEQGLISRRISRS